MSVPPPDPTGPAPAEKPAGPASKFESPWYMVLAGVVILGLGGKAAYWVVGDTWRGVASPTWETTQGTVVQSGLGQAYSSRVGAKYSLAVVYRYSVDGREYENDRLSFPEWSASGSESYYRKQLESKYPLGGSCTVYYNPGNPAESCLEPGPSILFIVVMGPLAIGLLALAVFVLRMGVRGVRDHRANEGRVKVPDVPGGDGAGGPGPA